MSTGAYVATDPAAPWTRCLSVSASLSLDGKAANALACAARQVFHSQQAVGRVRRSFEM